MTVVRKFKEGPEALCQKAVVKWFRLQYNEHRKRIIYIKNEGKTSFAGAASNKKKGLVKGASDLFIAVPSNGYHGLWLELKPDGFKFTPSNKPHIDRQLAFLESMSEVGYQAALAIGVDQAIDTIKAYMTPESVPAESVIQLLN